MAKLKKRAREEMFDAAIKKVTTAQQPSDKKFLAIEEKSTLAFMSGFIPQFCQPFYPSMPPKTSPRTYWIAG